jgi:putative hydrolase of the HAD superfamily
MTLRVKAVLFDLGGTLVNTASPPEIIGRILEKYGVKRAISEIALAHVTAERSMKLEDYGLNYYEFWIKWNKIILDRLGVHENADFLSKVLVDEWWNNADVEPYPDAANTLIGLKSVGVKIGIITNAFMKDVEEILARAELPRVFDILVGIDSVGKPKPHPEIFLHAIRTLKIQPKEALFIGDSLEKDYFGALNAGLIAILLDRKREFNNKHGLFKIEDLRRLLEIVKESEK